MLYIELEADIAGKRAATLFHQKGESEQQGQQHGLSPQEAPMGDPPRSTASRPRVISLLYRDAGHVSSYPAMRMLPGHMRATSMPQIYFRPSMNRPACNRSPRSCWCVGLYCAAGSENVAERPLSACIDFRPRLSSKR